MTAREKLRAWLAEHPNPCGDHTLTEIASTLGVSRQRVQQLMPTYAENGVAQRLLRFQQAIEEHPEIVLAPHLGGWTVVEAGAAVGVCGATITRWLRELGYPPKRMQFGTVSSSVLHREWANRPLATERCWNCGTSFPWTKRRDSFFRRGLQKSKVCSHQCGLKLRGLTREEAEARRGA